MDREEILRNALGEDYEAFVARKSARWVGSFTVDELLDSCLDNSHPWPPESNGVYVISRKAWAKRPENACYPLYVGSNTGKSARFATRIGDLVADMFGFFGKETGHSSGGISIHNWCMENVVNPKKLFIGWVDNCRCVRCAEKYLYNELEPKLNIKKPPDCKMHRGKERFLAAFDINVL